jgi:uncharacterized protein YndB with AHSA1/START domain
MTTTVDDEVATLVLNRPHVLNCANEQWASDLNAAVDDLARHEGLRVVVVRGAGRVGGRYRWRWRSDEHGAEFGFSGTFREVRPPSKLVHTEAYDPGTVGDDFPRNDAIVTVTFMLEGNHTTVTTLVDFGSTQARDAAVATGMTDGMEQSYQLLDRLLDEQPRA